MANKRLTNMERKSQRQTPKKKKKKEETLKPKTPKKDVSSQYRDYQNSSFAPKTVKPKKKETSAQKAQTAFETGQKVRASQQKNKVTNTSVVPKTSGNITDSFKTTKKERERAYKKGSTTTTLGTQQTETTTTLKSKKQQKAEYKQSKQDYYKSQDWKNTKNELKVKNQEGWRKALSDQGWTRKEIDDWMNSEEGKKYRKETYMESKEATKKAINDEIKKGIKDTSELKSVNALTKGEFNTMVTANAMGKERGNKYLETSTKRFGTEDIREKIGSKTAESAYKSKFMTGVLQGTSKADLFSGSVGTYNTGAREAIDQTKNSGAYLAGYGVGLAGDMAMGGIASRGASLAEMAGQGAGKLFGRGVAKKVPAKALQEATEEIAKVSGKQGLKRFAKNRAGEFVAESPINVLDAVKMSLDVDGNLDKKEFKKWLAINSLATIGIGGAMEGIGAGLTRKLGNETLELMAKKEAGTITPEELAQLEKNAKKLSQKTKGNASISSDIANKRLEDINKRSAKIAKEQAEAEAKEVPKGFYGGRKSRGQGEYTETARQTAKKNENARWNARVKKDIADTRARTPDRPTTIEEKRVAKQSAKKHEGNARRSAERARNKDVRRLQDEIRKRREELAEAEARANKKDNTVAGHTQAVRDVERLEKEIKFKESQLSKASNDTLSGRIGKTEKNLTKENTLQGHNKAVAEHERVTKELADDSKWIEKERKVEQALKKAKEKAEANPTEANNARVEMAEEALEKVKAEAKAEAKKAKAPEAPKAKTKNEANLTPEQKKLQKERDKAEKAYNEAKQAYEQWDKKGGEFYNKKQRAYDAGNKKLGDQYYTEYKNIQDEIAKREAEMKRLEAEFKAKNDAYVESRKGTFASLDEEMPMVKSSDKVKEVSDQIEEELGILKKPAKMEGNTINAETKGAKHPIFQKLREAFVSNEASLEDIAKKLPEKQREEFLGVINEFRRAVKTGRAVVAERGRSIYKKYGLTKRGAETEAKRKDFERYAFLMHELDRKRAGNNFTDLTRDQIRSEMRELELKYATNVNKETGEILSGNEIKSEVKDFQKDVRNYFRKLLGREVDAGITTAEEAKAFMEKYPNYIPTYREADFDQILKNRTLDEIDVGRGIKQATGGSERNVVPLYNQMQVKTNVVMKRVQLNKMLKCLTYASGTTEKELDDILPWFKNMDKEAKAEALLDSQVFTHSTGGKHLAVMYHQGARMEISIDKEVYDAIRRWSGEDRKWVTLCNLVDNRALRFVNSNFKKWITDYNLIFGVKNLKRDMATALFYTKDIKGFVKNMPKGFAVCLLPDKMLTKDMLKYKKAYQVYKENGGVISQFIARDSASDTFFDTANKLNPFKLVENFNSAMETIPRMTEFISALDSKALKAGGDYDKAFNSLLKNKDAIADAMYRAKDVTLNFDRSGWLGSKLNRGLVPFFNPAVQGLDKLGRKVITDNIKYGKNYTVNAGETMTSFLKAGAYLTGMVAMPAMAWNAVFGDYINGEVEGYEKQSDYNRYTNYLLPMGDGKFIKIPRARELASLQSMLDFAYDNMKYGEGSTWERLFSDQSERDLFSMGKIAWEQTGTLNPFSDSIIAPIWRVKENKTWYGGKIESGKDLDYREAGEYSKIWDEKTSATAKWIGKKFNISPKKVDNVMDSYLGVIYDMGISQTSANKDFREVAKESGWGKGLLQLTRTPWGNAFVIDSVFQNSNKSDYYNYVDKRNKKLEGLKEETDEYNKVKAEITKDKNAYSYTSSQYDELQAQIWLDKNLTMSQKKKYVRMLKKDDNLLWNERKDGNTAPSKDPMAVAWNMKDGNGKRVMSTKTILESCSYTNKTTGKNTILDAYDSYHALGGKSDKKFMEVTLSARDVNRVAGDSLSSPRWEVVAYSNQLNHIKGSDKVMASYIENDKKRNHLMENAKIYEAHGGDIKTYKTMRKTLTQGVFDLGYEYIREAQDGVKTMILANARTKVGKKYRDLAYQANDWYIMNRMNAGRCLDDKKNGNYKAKDCKAICDKYELTDGGDYKWDDKEQEKVIDAINKEYPNASNEVKASWFTVITGLTKDNPFGEIGDYSLDSDTGVYCEGSGYGGYGRGRRRRGHGGGGGRGSTFKPIINTAGKNAKVTDTTRSSKSNTSKKSSLDDAYRKNLKKLREQTRAK